MPYSFNLLCASHLVVRRDSRSSPLLSGRTVPWGIALPIWLFLGACVDDQIMTPPLTATSLKLQSHSPSSGRTGAPLDVVLRLNFSGNASHLVPPVSISPSIDGEWVAEGSDVLTFHPSAMWTPETRYDVSSLHGELNLDFSFVTGPSVNAG